MANATFMLTCLIILGVASLFGSIIIIIAFGVLFLLGVFEKLAVAFQDVKDIKKSH